jgi:UDP-N-acetylmuramate--alanine ligase
MNSFEGIAISGTHGKSTTTGWLVYCLRQAGLDVNFVVGADSPQLGGSSGSGDSEWFVAEACEYDRSFQNLKPRVACILNIERDHLDCYKDEEDIVESFYQFACGTRPDGLIVADGTDPERGQGPSAAWWLRATATVIDPSLTFGLDSGCDFTRRAFRRRPATTTSTYSSRGRSWARPDFLRACTTSQRPLAVIAIAVSIGVEPQRVLEVLDGFQGMDRRLMLKGQFGGITVIDDYAHHPTKIKASLRAVRERYRPQRLWCVFQAHQYSRTQSLLEEFAASFADADKVLIPEIFFARDTEASRHAVNARILTDKIRGRGTDAEYIAGFDAVCDCLEQNVRSGDVVITMGAGDVWKVADEYIQRLRRDR